MAEKLAWVVVESGNISMALDCRYGFYLKENF